MPPAQPVIERVDYEANKIFLHVLLDETGSVDSYSATCVEATNPLVSVTSVSQTPLITIGGLKDSVAYICQVRASNAAGIGSASVSTAPVTPEALPAGLPVWLLNEAVK